MGFLGIFFFDWVLPYEICKGICGFKWSLNVDKIRCLTS